MLLVAARGGRVGGRVGRRVRCRVGTWCCWVQRAGGKTRVCAHLRLPRAIGPLQALQAHHTLSRVVLCPTFYSKHRGKDRLHADLACNSFICVLIEYPDFTCTGDHGSVTRGARGTAAQRQPPTRCFDAPRRLRCAGAPAAWGSSTPATVDLPSQVWDVFTGSEGWWRTLVYVLAGSASDRSGVARRLRLPEDAGERRDGEEGTRPKGQRPT